MKYGIVNEMSALGEHDDGDDVGVVVDKISDILNRSPTFVSGSIF